jgi:DNA-binding MarR family transcriptional regulator
MSILGDQAEPSVQSLAASGPSSVQRIDAACRMAADGKLAARDITTWLRGSQINEPEFRLLWLLARMVGGTAASGSLDQAEMADQLVVSPAQVSGAVERLRGLGMLQRVADQRDRRRQLWQVTEAGQALLKQIVNWVAKRMTSDVGGMPPLAPRRHGPSSTFEGEESRREAAA